MCAKNKCCCALGLVRGVEAIAAAGLLFTLLYVVLSFIGGKEIFLILSFYHIHYVYVAIVLGVINFIVHFLLWQGARLRQRYKFLPFLVFIMLKSLALASIMVTLIRDLFEVYPCREEDGCSPSLQFRALSMLAVMAILGTHVYFWIVVYTLYSRLSSRNEAYLEDP